MIYLCICSKEVWTNVGRCLKRSEEGLRSPGVRDVGGCKQPVIEALIDLCSLYDQLILPTTEPLSRRATEPRGHGATGP